MDFEQVLALRQTTRKYTDQKVSDSDLEKILQAAQTAPLAAGDDKTTHLTLVKDLHRRMGHQAGICHRNIYLFSLVKSGIAEPVPL